MHRLWFGLALAGLLLASSGFDWVGETDRLVREYRVANVSRRREIIRLLADREGEASHAALIAALADPNDDVRREAMDACARAGFPEAWPALAALVVEGSAETRASAARGLGQSRDPAYLPVLVRALGDSEAVVRAAALLGLASLADDGARGPIEARLADDDARVRSAAATAIAALGSPLGTSALVSRVADEAPEVRLAVVQALGRLRDATAVPALEVALEDASEPVRVAAAIALSHMEHPRTVAILQAQLDGTSIVARSAASSLAVIGTDEALEALVAASFEPQTRLAARSALIASAGRDAGVSSRIARLLAQHLSDARGAAIISEATSVLDAVLAAHPEPAVTDALVRAMEHDREPLPALISALGHSGGEGALVPLLALATRGSARTRPVALRALTQLLDARGSDGRIADPLIDAITRTTDTDELALLVRALGYSGAERAVPALSRLTEHDSSEVRSAALEALGLVGSPLGTAPMLEALSSSSANERRSARHALGRSLDTSGVIAAIERAGANEPVDRVALLEAVTEAMPRVHAAFDAETRARLARSLTVLLESPRGEVASLAIEIAARADTAESRALIIGLATVPGTSRVEALHALAIMRDDAGRAVLRDAVRVDDAHVRAAALVGLGELGERSDLSLALAAGLRGPFHVTLASSFAAARLARRGMLQAEDADSLCTLGLDRDPVVRANILVARAVLGAAPCRAAATFDPVSEPFVLAAELRTTRPRTDEANAICAAPIEAIVRAACEEDAWPALDGQASVTAFDADGRSLLASRFVAVAFADGTVLPIQSSRAARVVLDHVARGPMMLFDPSRTSLER